MTIPNLITLGRLLLVPVIVMLTAGGYHRTALVVFVIAGVSDAVDGALARILRMQSELGARLDPIADKALLISIYMVLAWLGALPVWLTLVVVGRDVLILAAIAAAWFGGRPIPIAPRLASKANTAAQMVLAAVVLAGLGLAIDLEFATAMLTFAVTITVAVSSLDYLAVWVRRMAPHGRPMTREPSV